MTDHELDVRTLRKTALPRILGDTAALIAGSEPDATGAIWKLPMAQRDLDSNVIQLPAGARIEAHAGPELDVLLVVLAGAGTLETAVDTLEIVAGELVWLPRRSRRGFVAGRDGLTYLTVHQRKPGLGLTERPRPGSAD
jgi:quercetin dioxygenase-like cupin family protein